MTKFEAKVAEVDAKIAAFFTKPVKADKIVALKVGRDANGWIVMTADSGYSFARMPIGFDNEFDTKAEAVEQMRRLDVWQAKGQRLAFHTYMTPDRFEAVADTVYGSAW